MVVTRLVRGSVGEKGADQPVHIVVLISCFVTARVGNRGLVIIFVISEYHLVTQGVLHLRAPAHRVVGVGSRFSPCISGRGEMASVVIGVRHNRVVWESRREQAAQSVIAVARRSTASIF